MCFSSNLDFLSAFIHLNGFAGYNHRFNGQLQVPYPKKT